MRAALSMIKSFKHRGLRKFFETGSKAGIIPAHAKKLAVQLFAPDDATKPNDMNSPGWDLHVLHGEFEGYWSISVNGNWRMTFRFAGTDAEVVDYQDYH